MLNKHVLSGILVSLTMLLGACATDSTSMGSATTAPTDATLTNSVTDAVNAVSGVNRNDLNVSVQQGVVTLRGQTHTRAQAQDAIEAARHVPGVVKVDYDISVDEP